jgi:hypothetical protein
MKIFGYFVAVAAAVAISMGGSAAVGNTIVQTSSVPQVTTDWGL